MLRHKLQENVARITWPLANAATKARLLCVLLAANVARNFKVSRKA